MNNKTFHPAWHFVYIGLIGAALWWWKCQHDTHLAWLNYVAPTNNSLLQFLKKDGEINMSIIMKATIDYPAPFTDSLEKSAESLCGLAQKMNEQCIAIANKSVQETSVASLEQPWHNYTTALVNIDNFDTLLQPGSMDLIAVDAFEDWKVMYEKGNTTEQAYLLSSLQRLVYTTLSIALNQKMNQITDYQEGAFKFDQLHVGFETNHVPIAGEPFRVEFYPVWYSNESDNVTLYIDNRKYNFENGIAHCDTVYRTPGKKKVIVKMEVKNPATGQINTMKKVFEIAVF